jgi:proline iminopeptidase
MRSKNGIKFTLLTIILLVLLIGCQPKTKLIAGEGYIEVTGGKIWYNIIGEGDKTPILLLHGGPGATSYYLNPLAALGKDRPVIFFDQLGCGRSGNKIDVSMMNTEFFVEEVRQIKEALGLKEYYLYGQSWGTMLGTDFYLTHPEGIKAIILSSPAISSPMWIKDADYLLSKLPDSLETIIRKHEADQTFDSSEYQEAMMVYYQKHIARKLPWSADIDSTFTYINEEVYTHMWGPSEFTVSGNLRDFDRTEKLKEIKIPTLFITGEFDEARPTTVAYYDSLVPNSKFVIIKDAAHMTMQDNPEQDVKEIRDFLKEIEK